VVLAAQVRGPLGDFLIGNWTQFPAEYSRMLAFGLIFAVVSIGFTIVIENVYERSPILPKLKWADPVMGGILGMVEAMIAIGAGILILDSYFRDVGAIVRPNELLFIRDFDHAIDVSEVAKLYRLDFIPGFFALLGGFFPGDLRALFPR
jgi:hypothetical protein